MPTPIATHVRTWKQAATVSTPGEMQSTKSEAPRLQANKQTKNTSNRCVHTDRIMEKIFSAFFIPLTL